MISSERKRRRPAVSCALCRRRKIRCNRETPCSNCMKSRNTVCVYETEPQLSSSRNLSQLPSSQVGHRAIGTDIVSTNSARSTTSAYATTSSSPTSISNYAPFELEAMKARIAELEEKLSKATSSTASVVSVASSSPAATHTVQTVTSLAGVIEILQDNRRFGREHGISRGIAHKNRLFGQSHWMNGFIVFRDIIEMIEPTLRSRSSPILANMTRAKNLARVIKTQRTPEWPTVPTKDLPHREICDKLVAGYLRTMETIYRVLHVPSFQSDYEAVWLNNSDSKMGFIMLLKLVLAIGATVYDEKFSMRTDAIRWVYEAQTWMSSPDFKSRLGIQYMQISILLLLARQLINVGSDLVWISVGSVFRAAVYIGLHKDPSQLPRLSTFDAEMRRRIWNTILEISLQTSLESGGPCFVSLEDFTTAPPSNFDDEQLTMSDPIAMPDHVYTQTSIAIKFRETFPARLAVVKFLNDTASTGTYDETLRIDTELRAVYKTLRRNLQGYAVEDTPVALRFEAQAAEFLIQRFISSLHIPFYGPSLDNPVHAFSRKAVVDSSLKIWALACPSSTAAFSSKNALDTSNSDSIEPIVNDLARLCICSSGLFRTYAFHTSSFLGVELRTQIQEEEDMSSISLHPGLFPAMKDATSWYLRCIEAGETGIKGYILLRLLFAQVNAMRQRVHHIEIPGILIRAAEEATDVCLTILEAMAGQERGGNTHIEPQDFNFETTPDLMEDWDLVMSDILNIGDVGSLNSFLI